MLSQPAKGKMPIHLYDHMKHCRGMQCHELNQLTGDYTNQKFHSYGFCDILKVTVTRKSTDFWYRKLPRFSITCCSLPRWPLPHQVICVTDYVSFRLLTSPFGNIFDPHFIAELYMQSFIWLIVSYKKVRKFQSPRNIGLKLRDFLEGWVGDSCVCRKDFH